VCSLVEFFCTGVCVRVGTSVFPCGVLLYGSIFPSINTMMIEKKSNPRITFLTSIGEATLALQAYTPTASFGKAGVGGVGLCVSSRDFL
jgi:hypothetical protein